MFNKSFSKLVNWVDTRYNITPIKNFIEHKKVPVHKHSLFYYLGGISLFLFIVQVITGILLLMYYKPGEESAYESVRFILTDVNFGWLIRNVHSWSANLMIFFTFAHMFSVYFTKAYQKPRELTWVTGFLLLTLALGFGFSGYLLPWNQLAFFATKVGTDITGAVPVVGPFMLRFLRGGGPTPGGQARGARGAGAARGTAAGGAGTQGRSLRARTRRDQARVVFRLDVPDPAD